MQIYLFSEPYGDPSGRNDSEQSNRSNIISKEFLTYLSDADTDTKTFEKYPVLKKASLKFNTPLTSSAPVERLFSFAGIINSPRRHALTDVSFEKLVLLKANSQHC